VMPRVRRLTFWTLNCSELESGKRVSVDLSLEILQHFIADCADHKVSFSNPILKA
jgi:hypothetical protein